METDNSEVKLVNAKVEYFIEETNKRLDRIDSKLEQLISFRIMLIGAAATISVVFSAVTTLIMIFLQKGA
jgi:tetrahydromethanopterin S-methyltransferase subunit G